MNKVTKFLLIVLFIVLGIYLLVNGYIKEEENIANKVGYKIGGGSLSVTDYYTLSQCFDTYKDYLINKKYETAYMMLSPSYRNYVSYEDYKEIISTENMTKLKITDINAITNTTFDVQTEISGDVTHYSIVIDNSKNTFSIYPYSFLDYKVVNQKNNKKSLDCILKDYVVNIDKCVLNFEVKNKSKKDEAIFTNEVLYTNTGTKIESDEIIKILPGETKNIQVIFDTDYDFPSKVILKRNISGKDSFIEYSFDIKN